MKEKQKNDEILHNMTSFSNFPRIKIPKKVAVHTNITYSHYKGTASDQDIE